MISSVGILSIRGTRDSGAKGSMEDPMAILERGYSITVVLAVLTFGAVIHYYIIDDCVMFLFVLQHVTVESAANSQFYLSFLHHLKI